MVTDLTFDAAYNPSRRWRY